MAQRTKMLMKNIAYVGYTDLNRKPGFQMAMYKSPKDRYYIYTACFRDNGFNIVDVTDPANPVSTWMEGDWVSDVHDGQSLPKIQTGDGKLIAIYGGTMRVLHGTKEMEHWGGIKIYDIEKDPMHPEFLGQFYCDGPGAHRCFYNGGDYVYVVGGKKGFLGFVLRIVDISDPTHPVEVSSYWSDGQYLQNKFADEIPEFGTEAFMKLPNFHAVTVKDDIIYAAQPNEGFCLIDIKDKTNPQLIGKLPLNPPFGNGQGGAAVHTAMPLGDRPFAVITTEGERVRYFSNENSEGEMFHPITSQPMNIIGMVETGDMRNPSLISIFPYPQMPEGYTHGENFNVVDGVRAVLGPHNMFDAFGQDCYEKRDDRVYNCYFHAGLRVYDVSDPFVPKEIAYFLPPDPQGENWFDNEEGTLLPGPKVAITEDVLVDDRGYIYLTTFQDGMYIVKCTV